MDTEYIQFDHVKNTYNVHDISRLNMCIFHVLILDIYRIYKLFVTYRLCILCIHKIYLKYTRKNINYTNFVN